MPVPTKPTGAILLLFVNLKSLKSWLYESDLRPNILGIISSHISHGGEGAFYVYLKSNKIL